MRRKNTGISMIFGILIVALFFGFSNVLAEVQPKGVGQYVLYDLGMEFVSDINNKGQIVGYSYFYEDGLISHPLLWDNGTIVDLGVPDGYYEGYATAINDKGQIIVRAFTDGSRSTTQSFLWQDGNYNNLGKIGISNHPTDINNLGQIIGGVTFANGVNHSYLWTNGEWVDIDGEDETSSYALAINDIGLIVGSTSSLNHAIWQGGDWAEIADLGDNYGSPQDINEKGEVAGTVSIYAGSYAYKWSNGTLVKLGPIDGNGLESSASSINELGHVVGTTYSYPGRATLWLENNVVDLNSFLPANSEVFLTSAIAINDLGDIVCEGVINETDSSVFLLAASTSYPPHTATPSPTPTYTPTPTQSSNYIPVIVKRFPLPTATPTASPTPTPVPPLAVGESIRFKGFLNGVPMEGVVKSSRFRTSLKPDYGERVYPHGIFLVVRMDVTNLGKESDDVGRYNSFKVEDSQGRLFDLAELDVQWAAEDEYDVGSIYDTIQPGFTLPLVFVFDVMPEETQFRLVSMSRW